MTSEIPHIEYKNNRNETPVGLKGVFYNDTGGSLLLVLFMAVSILLLVVI